MKINAGDIFGEWEVLSYVGKSKWKCKCSCGNIKDINGYTLTHGKSTSCGCRRKKKVNIGDTFNNLKVIGYCNELTSDGRSQVLCKCTLCGKTTTALPKELISGHKKSCSCLVRSSKGESSTRLYNIWENMMHRCYNHNNKAYKYYGKRGIVVSPLWTQFFNFKEDMEDSYHKCRKAPAFRYGDIRHHHLSKR